MSLSMVNTFQVELREGVFGYDRQGWRALTSLSDAVPGWRPVRLARKAIADIGVLLWVTETASAIWFVDDDDRFLCNRIADLPGPSRDAVTEFVRKMAAERGMALVEGRQPEMPAHLDGELCGLLLEDWLSGETNPSAFEPLGRATHLPYLAETLDEQSSRIEVGTEGDVVLTVLHPRSGERVAVDHSICLDDFRSLCPVSGERGLFLCRAGHKASFIALYDAVSGVIYVGPGKDDHWMTPHFFRRIEQNLFEHIVEYESELISYLLKPTCRLAAVLRNPPHLGHQLYNELGGLARLVELSRGARRPPLVVVTGDAHSEIYGPTDELFPELIGSVVRWGADWVSQVYRNRLCAMRLTVERVSEGVRSRVVGRASRTHLVQEDRQTAESLKRGGSPVVLYGLRVENRTLLDQTAFLTTLALRLKAEWPDATLVIDGHNVRYPGADEVYASAQNCRRDPFDFEREIVAEVVAYCEGIGLPVLDLVGAVMERSVFWSAQATAFVAPWGAGLAKYRWLGNCPGVVLSNRWNIRHRSDFQIYMDPIYMDDPSKIEVLDESHVRDVDDMSSLLMSHPPDQPADSAMNFEVDVDEVVAALRRVMPFSGEIADGL